MFPSRSARVVLPTLLGVLLDEEEEKVSIALSASRPSNAAQLQAYAVGRACFHRAQRESSFQLGVGVHEMCQGCKFPSRSARVVLPTRSTKWWTPPRPDVSIALSASRPSNKDLQSLLREWRTVSIALSASRPSNTEDFPRPRSRIPQTCFHRAQRESSFQPGPDRGHADREIQVSIALSASRPSNVYIQLGSVKRGFVSIALSASRPSNVLAGPAGRPPAPDRGFHRAQRESSFQRMIGRSSFDGMMSKFPSRSARVVLPTMMGRPQSPGGIGFPSRSARVVLPT